MSKSTTTCLGCGTSCAGEPSKTNIVNLALIGVLTFVILATIGILAAIVLPSFGAREMARNSRVKSNMRSAQVAVESYATDFQGLYPLSVDSKFKAYYPCSAQTQKGSAPINPFTGKPEWPIMGKISDVKAARMSDVLPQLGPGVIEYSVIMDSHGRPFSYAIRGADARGMTILGSGRRPLILSNQ
jgi:type II secretory pathway pseudopilin PulG